MKTMVRPIRRMCLISAVAAGGIAAAGGAQTAAPAQDGVVHVQAFDLPLSEALSPEARQYMVDRLRQRGIGLPEGISPEADYVAYVEGMRAGLNKAFVPLAEQAAKTFKVKFVSQKIAGVPVEVFDPEAGVSTGNANRVLINLHGGGFFSGAVYAGRVESIPIAAGGRMRVVSVDYRQGYEYKFPAASEDVAAVYKELLKTYPAKNIGIFGCSAGGSLTAQTVAWLLHKNLPLPGAIGIFGSGAGRSRFKGDSYYFSSIAEGRAPAPGAITAPRLGYFSDVEPGNPLVEVLKSTQLSKFPPTMITTATRATDLSPALETHRALTRAGVDADLHVWDGLGHCFQASTSMFLPESRDAQATIVRFFDRHLGK